MSNVQNQNDTKENKRSLEEPSQTYSVIPNTNNSNNRPDIIKPKQKKKKK